jgi:hypothetical protein
MEPNKKINVTCMCVCLAREKLHTRTSNLDERVDVVAHTDQLLSFHIISYVSFRVDASHVIARTRSL